MRRVLYAALPAILLLSPTPATAGESAIIVRDASGSM
jgi:hypothetical protein